MSEDSAIVENKRLCGCGCGGFFINDKRRNRRHYIRGHSPGRYRKGDTRGSLHPQWKGGKSMHIGGYIQLNARYDHPRNHNGRILEHIVVYEQYHKCCLLRWSNIHHINDDKTDNRPENLQGMTRPQHTALHSRIKTALKVGRAYHAASS